MYNISLNILSAIFIVLFLSTCTEDFQLTEPYKDIPVIYAVINRTDSAQYFRIEKAFVDENIAATQIAKNPDSIYYPNPVVTLKNLTTKKDYLLIKVDGSQEGITRQSGPFATTPNILYKLLTKDKFLNGGDSLLLELKPYGGPKTITARIILVSDISFVIPDENTRQIKIFYNSSFNFQWKHKDNTRVFDLKAIVDIDEFNLVTLKTEKKLIEVPLARNVFGNIGRADNLSSTKLFGATFYIFFNDKLIPDPSIERYINKIDFILIGGGPEIGDYNTILNANTGITASQEIPRYSNISEGYGIFSSTVRIIKTITPEPPTIDSLNTNSLTRELNFR